MLLSFLFSKTVPQLPVEILSDILWHVGPSPHALHPLLRVSRSWCRIVVPLLWAAPFAAKEGSHPKLITAYMRCLADHERKYLFENEVVLAPEKPTLFPYMSYLQSLEDELFVVAINFWLRDDYGFVSTGRARALRQTLTMAILNQATNLNHLQVSSIALCRRTTQPEEFTNRLVERHRQLRSLSITCDRTSSTDYRDGLVANVISAQGALRAVVIDYAERFVTIAEALKKHAGCLRRLTFSRCIFGEYSVADLVREFTQLESITLLSWQVPVDQVIQDLLRIGWKINYCGKDRIELRRLS